MVTGKTKNDNSTAGAKKKKKKKIRPKLKPISSQAEYGAKLSPGSTSLYSDFLPAVTREKSVDATAALSFASSDKVSVSGNDAKPGSERSTPAVSNSKIKPRISVKIQPRPALYPEDDPYTPDDDDYDAFGFGLVKTKGGATPKEPADTDLNVSSVPQKKQTSPLSLRRVLSSESYVSDSSTSTEENALHLQQIQRILMKEEDAHENVSIQEQKGEKQENEANEEYSPIRVPHESSSEGITDLTPKPPTPWRSILDCCRLQVPESTEDVSARLDEIDQWNENPRRQSEVDAKGRS